MIAHVSDDPARAVAHGDADPVALADPARRQAQGDRVRPAIEVGEGQPLVAGDDRFAGPGRARKMPAADSGTVAGKLATIARPWASCSMTSRPAGAGDAGQACRQTGCRARSAFKDPLSFALCGSPSYEALNLKGEVLASRQSPTTQSPGPTFACHRSRSTSACSSFAGTASPISPAFSSAIGIC